MDQHDTVASGSLVRNVAVGIPLKGHTSPKSYNDRMMMSFLMGQREAEQRLRRDPVTYQFNWFFAGEIFIPFAREHLAMMALKYDCEYLFMIDDDMMAPFDLFYQLAKHDVDICSALAFTRNPPYRPVVYATKEGWDPVVKSRYYGMESVLNYPRNSLVQCDAVGFGAVLIKTKLFKEMPKPWFMSSAETGEDILFCCKAREAGFKVYCDTSIKLGHLSEQVVITEDYSDQYNKMTAEDQESKYGKYMKYETMELVR